MAFSTLLLLLSSPSVPAQSVADELPRVMPWVIEERRAIHAHPELGEREHETARRVAERLERLGLEVRRGIGGTGVVGLLRGGRPGPVVAYRADMDGLPITERTGLPYASKRTDSWAGKEVGVMHACGHDMHVAVALGVAGVLAAPEMRSSLPGTVVFVFQPAEEGMPDKGLHGAHRMVQEGAFADPRPEAVFGLHVNPLLPLGQVSAVPGGAMAAVDRFVIDIRGKQAHGAYPQAGIDPIVIASHVVTALQTIASRNIDTRDAVVVTIGKIEAGNRYNIIPETAQLIGTLRTHDEDVRSQVHRRLEQIATGVAASLGGSAEVEVRGITPVTYNDPELVRRMRPTFIASVGEGNLVEEKAHMGGEDFAYFAREAPGLYYFLGVTDFSKGFPALVHTAEFSPEEAALEVGVRTSSHLLLAYLSAGD